MWQGHFSNCWYKWFIEWFSNCPHVLLTELQFRTGTAAWGEKNCSSDLPFSVLPQSSHSSYTGNHHNPHHQYFESFWISLHNAHPLLLTPCEAWVQEKFPPLYLSWESSLLASPTSAISISIVLPKVSLGFYTLSGLKRSVLMLHEGCIFFYILNTCIKFKVPVPSHDWQRIS